MKEAIKHEYVKIGDELLGFGFAKGKYAFPRAIFQLCFFRHIFFFFSFFPWAEICILNICLRFLDVLQRQSYSSTKGIRVPNGHRPSRALPAAAPPGCFSQAPLAGQSHHSSSNWKWFLGVRDKKRLLRGRGLEREHYSYQIHGTWGTRLDSQPSYFYTFFFTALGRYWHKENQVHINILRLAADHLTK